MCKTMFVSCHASQFEMKFNWLDVQAVVVSLVWQADYPHPSSTDETMLHAKASSADGKRVSLTLKSRQRSF